MNNRNGIVVFAGLMLVFVYAILVFGAMMLVEGQSPVQSLMNFLLLAGGFGLALGGAAFRILRALQEYVRDLHDIDSKDGGALMTHLIFGMPPVVAGTSPGVPVLRVQAGAADISGPPIVHKVGGPAKLAIDHNSAVVTCRLGILCRVLGPGLHNLAPFERLWSVVDLRPQRRNLTIDFMTRDGIPASCQASIVCRVAGPPASLAEADDPNAIMPYKVLDDKVLQVATAQVMRKLEGNDRVSDWVAGISMGALDGEVRDALEQYSLDQLLDPRVAPSVRSEPGSSLPRRFTPDVERIIQRSVRRIGRDRGIIVERVELGTVRPAEAAISEQWVAFWQAKLQHNIDEHRVMVGSDLVDKAQHEHISAQVEFVSSMFDQIEKLELKGKHIPPQLILAGFMEVLNSMYDHGPEVQQLLLWQAQNLLSAIDTLQRDQSMFARSFQNVGYRLPPES